MASMKELIQRLEALLGEMKVIEEGPRPTPAPKRTQEPETKDVSGYRSALVTWWGVKASPTTGKPFGRVGLTWIEGGEEKSGFMNVFDAELLARIDPLKKGSTVLYSTMPLKNGGEKIVDLKVSRVP